MNKKNFIKLCIGLLAIMISFFVFIITRYDYSKVNVLMIPLGFALALPIFMNYKYKSISDNKFKKIYLMIMIIFYIMSFIILMLLIISVFGNFAYMIDANGNRLGEYNLFGNLDEFNNIFSVLFFMATSWLMLFVLFNDIDRKVSRINYILVIIASVIIILINTNYLLNPNLQKDINVRLIDEKALYVTQNYIYFGIMYSVSIVNRFINDEQY